jgi:hypothetical protein
MQKMKSEHISAISQMEASWAPCFKWFPLIVDTGACCSDFVCVFLWHLPLLHRVAVVDWKHFCSFADTNRCSTKPRNTSCGVSSARTNYLNISVVSHQTTHHTLISRQIRCWAEWSCSPSRIEA